MMAQNLVSNQAIAVNVANMIRWQNHWHVARQSWAFFQNDFAGRIANRVMQTGPAVRESLVALITGVWYILVYGTAALILLASADRWLALPILLWFAGYVVMLRVFVPRMRDRSKEVSEARSWLIGRIVDTYTNILTVKLFARARDEDAYVREAFEEHTGLFYGSLRLNTLFSFCLSTLNAMLVTGTGAHGDLAVGPRQGRGRHRGDGAAAVVADHLHRRLGGDARHRNLREHRRGAGGHDDDRPADHAHRPARRRRAEGAARRDRVQGHPLRLRPRERADRRAVAHHPSRRAHRPDRPLRRRQVHAGQPDAALLRSRGRPHPDRRPGHRATRRRRACAPRFRW